MKNKFKKILILTLSLSLLLGCVSDEKRLDESIGAFMQGLKEYDREAMDKYMADESLEQIFRLEDIEDDYLRYFVGYFLEEEDYLKTFAGDIDYEIDYRELEKDKARLGLRISYRDAVDFYQSSFTDLMESEDYKKLVDAKKDEDIFKYIDKTLASRETLELPLVEEKLDLYLKKKGSKYLVEGLDSSFENIVGANLGDFIVDRGLDMSQDGLGQLEGGRTEELDGRIESRDLGEILELGQGGLRLETVEELDQLDGFKKSSNSSKFIVVEGELDKDASLDLDRLILVDDQAREYAPINREDIDLAGGSVSFIFEVDDQLSAYSILVGGEKIKYEIILR